MKKNLIYPFLLTSFIAFSQEKYNPFEGIGKSTEVVTLSNGKYKEIYGGDTLKRIGSVIFDTKNNKVVQFLAEDDTVTMVVKKEGDYATRWLSLDPLAAKYPSMSPYNFVNNMPISAIDPDGRDIVVLNDPTGAGYRGHQALLISNKDGSWTYYSKDGATIGGPLGKSIVSIVTYKSIEEFAMSEHNFQKEKDGSFKKDENGNKIVRYTRAYLIETDSNTDEQSKKVAEASVKSSYVLTQKDCSIVVKEALDVAKTPDGQPITNGEFTPSKTPEIETKWFTIPSINTTKLLDPLGNYNPNKKQDIIEQENEGVRIDEKMKPKPAVNTNLNTPKP